MENKKDKPNTDHSGSTHQGGQKSDVVEEITRQLHGEYKIAEEYIERRSSGISPSLGLRWRSAVLV